MLLILNDQGLWLPLHTLTVSTSQNECSIQMREKFTLQNDMGIQIPLTIFKICSLFVTSFATLKPFAGCFQTAWQRRNELPQRRRRRQTHSGQLHLELHAMCPGWGRFPKAVGFSSISPWKI